MRWSGKRPPVPPAVIWSFTATVPCPRCWLCSPVSGPNSSESAIGKNGFTASLKKGRFHHGKRSFFMDIPCLSSRNRCGMNHQAGKRRLRRSVRFSLTRARGSAGQIPAVPGPLSVLFSPRDTVKSSCRKTWRRLPAAPRLCRRCPPPGEFSFPRRKP